MCRWMRIRGLWWVLVRLLQVLLQVLLLVLVLVLQLLQGNWEWGNRLGLVGCPGRRVAT